MYKIVIVDDESEVSGGLARYFPWKENGFEVVRCFNNAHQALEYLEQTQADVLITDICMPGMSGLELVKELRMKKINLQMILLSAYKNFQYAQQAMFYGVKYYLVKPASYSEVLEILENVKQDLNKAAEGNVHNLKKNAGLNAKIIFQINNYIAEHYDTVTLPVLSELTHMNESYLSRFYRENTGETISAYIMQVKMKQALRLLQDISYKNIYQVAETLGYTNAKSFSKAFKSFYGLNPQEYRNSFSNEEQRDE